MLRFLTSVAVLALLSVPLSAHHGTSGQFDATKIIEIDGVITKMAFVNPHSYVYFDVVESDGDVVSWNCELRASSVMRRSGWTKDMFAVGTHIDIVGVASRKDPKGCYVETISFNGSAPIARYDQINPDMLKPLPKARVLTTKWGTPNLAGDWAANQRLHGQITAANAKKIEVEELEHIIEAEQTGGNERNNRRRRGASFNYTQAGLNFIKDMEPQAGDNVTGRLDCTPRDFFSDWTFDQPTNRIEQTEDTLILRYGFMDTIRTIHMTDSFPETLEPNWAGYSIGAWDGDDLIVTTRGFGSGGSERRGFHSDQLETTERFSLIENGTAIKRVYEAFDPLFWQVGSKRTGEDIVYVSEVDYEAYNCDDRSLE